MIILSSFPRDVTRILGIISQLFSEANKGADHEDGGVKFHAQFELEVVFQPRIATKFFLVGRQGHQVYDKLLLSTSKSQKLVHLMVIVNAD